MSQQKQIKRFKFGSVNKKKDGSGSTIRVGNFSKNAKFATSVEIIIRDGNGNVVAEVNSADTEKYPHGLYLTVSDPRDRDGITAEQAEKIPDYLLKEINLVVAE